MSSTVEPGELKMAPLAELHESPLNPRKYFAPGPLAELADSIRASGVHNPLIVRSRIEGGGYEIGAGHRRYRAAKMAGVAAVPVIIRDMPDSEFRKLLAFENLNREDLHPLEEAEGMAMYMRESLADVAAIQKETGYSRTQVYDRLKLLEAIPEAQTACWDKKISAGHLVLIARLDQRVQRQALRACEPPAGDPTNVPSVRDLKRWIARNIHIDLHGAVFSTASAELLPDAGSCTDCPHRVGNLPDFVIGEDIPDVCTQPACYQSKIAAHIEKEKARLEAVNGELICVSTLLRTDLPGVVPSLQYRQVRQHTMGAKEALIVEVGETSAEALGRVIPVVIQEPLEAPTPVPASPAATETKPSKEELARQKQERDRQAQIAREAEATRKKEREDRESRLKKEGAIRKQILTAVLEKVKWPPHREDFARLLEGELAELTDDLDAHVKAQGAWAGNSSQPWDKITDSGLARLIVVLNVARDFDEFAYGHGCDVLATAAKRYGVDYGKLRAELEGGTRKEVVGKLGTLSAAGKKNPPSKSTPQRKPAKAHAKKTSSKKSGKK